MALEGCLEKQLAEIESSTDYYQKSGAQLNEASHSNSRGRADASEKLVRERGSKQETEPSKRCKELRRRGQISVFGGEEESTGPSSKQVTECESIIQDLLTGDAQCETEFGSFGYALHLAAFCGDTFLVQLLLDRGADINAYGAHFGSSLFAALEAKHLSVVDLLLERRVDVRTTSNGRLTPLHQACLQNFTGAISSLLEYGAEPNARDDQQRTPLSCALSVLIESYPWRHCVPRSSSHPEAAFRTLLQHSKVIEISQDDLVTSAASNFGFGQPEPLKILLEYDETIVVTEKTFMTVLGRSSVDREFLGFLLNRAVGLVVTEDMLKSTRDSHVLEVLLHQQSICKITPSILESQADRKCIKLLLEYDTQVVPTTTLVVNVLQMYDFDEEPEEPDCLRVLWKRNPDLKVTNDVLKEASSPKDMKFLLERCDSEMHITEEVLAAMLELWLGSAENLRLLLRHDQGLKVPADLVLESLGHRDSVELLNVLLEHNPAMSITQEMLLEMFSRPHCSKEEKAQIVELMHRFGKTVNVTQAVRAQVLSIFQSQSQADMRKMISDLMI